MSIVDWAEVVLPLLALGWGVCLVAMYPEVIDEWIARFNAWWAEQSDTSERWH